MKRDTCFYCQHLLSDGDISMGRIVCERCFTAITCGTTWRPRTVIDSTVMRIHLDKPMWQQIPLSYHAALLRYPLGTRRCVRPVATSLADDQLTILLARPLSGSPAS